jgi:LmbE family N-acetylglucosaminyl deacetylase
MPAAIAIAAHPDDIEFYMAGTLLLLRRAGWETHYFNLSSGNCGSLTHSAGRTRTTRRAEARAAARLLGARWHPPVGDDLEIVYDVATLRQVAAVVRAVGPSIVLTHSPQDYMEDHTTTCRLAVTAAFARGMPNFRTSPSRAPVTGDVAVYHAMPHGLRDGLRRRIAPGAWVNTSAVHATKRQALAAHRSQKDWLDASQGMDSYLRAMEEMSRAVARLAPVAGKRRAARWPLAEGWRRHLHLGFSGTEVDPLAEALGPDYLVNERYERALNQV